ncbi:MAG: hypothetical protein HYV60_22370 [Planctomycetia bacterium]|nr:hypothetical protein [Planctomycetia bacterium]
MPLFADQVAAERPTPEERIVQFDDRLLDGHQGRRDLAAKQWRWARRQLAGVSADIRAEIVTRWNASSIPPEAHYFADFIRTQFRRRYLSIIE